MAGKGIDEQNDTIEKLERRLKKSFAEAIRDFSMIEEGDKIMVCLSGGKDSYTMLDLFMQLKRVSPVNFNLVAVNLDQKQPGFPEHILPNYLNELGVKYRIIEKDTYSVVVDKIEEGKTMCSLCSRLRRGTLYAAAEEMGITKIALGHHREDTMETMFLNMFFNGRIEAMPAKYVTDDKKHVVIRPLSFCREKDIERYAKHKAYPIIPCNLCGSQDGLQRMVVKEMLRKWDQVPGRVDSVFRSMKHISTTHMLDKTKHNFDSIRSEMMKEILD